MSEFRLNAKGHSSSRYVALFEAAPLRIFPEAQIIANQPFPPEARARMLVGDEEIDVVFPLDASEVRQDLLETARSALSQLVELDATASLDFDGTVEDGYLACVEVVGPSEVDLSYFAAHVNSEWNEVFVRNEAGRWLHTGVRRRQVPAWA